MAATTTIRSLAKVARTIDRRLRDRHVRPDRRGDLRYDHRLRRWRDHRHYHAADDGRLAERVCPAHCRGRSSARRQWRRRQLRYDRAYQHSSRQRDRHLFDRPGHNRDCYESFAARPRSASTSTATGRSASSPPTPARRSIMAAGKVATAWVAGNDGILVRDANHDGQASADRDRVRDQRQRPPGARGLRQQPRRPAVERRCGLRRLRRCGRTRIPTASSTRARCTSLMALGIASISLTSDGIGYSAAGGDVSVVGTGSFTWANGSTGVLADAVFATGAAVAQQEQKPALSSAEQQRRADRRDRGRGPGRRRASRRRANACRGPLGSPMG